MHTAYWVGNIISEMFEEKDVSKHVMFNHAQTEVYFKVHNGTIELFRCSNNDS